MSKGSSKQTSINAKSGGIKMAKNAKPERGRSLGLSGPAPRPETQVIAAKVEDNAKPPQSGTRARSKTSSPLTDALTLTNEPVATSELADSADSLGTSPNSPAPQQSLDPKDGPPATPALGAQPKRKRRRREPKHTQEALKTVNPSLAPHPPVSVDGKSLRANPQKSHRQRSFEALQEEISKQLVEPPSDADSFTTANESLDHRKSPAAPDPMPFSSDGTVAEIDDASQADVALENAPTPQGEPSAPAILPIMCPNLIIAGLLAALQCPLQCPLTPPRPPIEPLDDIEEYELEYQTTTLSRHDCSSTTPPHRSHTQRRLRGPDPHLPCREHELRDRLPPSVLLRRTAKMPLTHEFELDVWAANRAAMTRDLGVRAFCALVQNWRAYGRDFRAAVGGIRAGGADIPVPVLRPLMGRRVEEIFGSINGLDRTVPALEIMVDDSGTLPDTHHPGVKVGPHEKTLWVVSRDGWTQLCSPRMLRPGRNVVPLPLDPERWRWHAWHTGTGGVRESAAMHWDFVLAQVRRAARALKGPGGERMARMVFAGRLARWCRLEWRRRWRVRGVLVEVGRREVEVEAEDSRAVGRGEFTVPRGPSVEVAFENVQTGMVVRIWGRKGGRRTVGLGYGWDPDWLRVEPVAVEREVPVVDAAISSGRLPSGPVRPLQTTCRPARSVTPELWNIVPPPDGFHPSSA